MKRLLLILTLLATSAVPLSGQTITYEGFRNIRPAGNDTSYMRNLTHRYVDGELRFLTMTHNGIVREFRITDTPINSSAVITQTTGSWNISGTGALADHSGLWFEQEKNRLWVTRAYDYTATYFPAQVTLIDLGAGGAVTVLKQFTLNVPAKRMFGGCQKTPAPLVAQLGGPYVCGWGGYTSLTEQGGGAAIGPTMFAIPDPDTIANGATNVSARTILDTGLGSQNRGIRQTIPINYFDGGDPRVNPSTPPTDPPLATALWQSPNAEGQGWMVWGDSYYNNGMWIGNTYAAVASLCKGRCYYMSSNLRADDRQFELHLWNGTTLGSNPLQRPNHMMELVVPRGNTWHTTEGGWPSSMTGATYDPVSGRIYAVIYPGGPDVYTGRLYSFTVSGGSGPTPTPPPDPEPEPEPEPEPPSEVTHADLKTLMEQVLKALTPVVIEPPTASCTVAGQVRSYANGDHQITIRCASADLARPVTGQTLRVVKE